MPVIWAAKQAFGLLPVAKGSYRFSKNDQKVNERPHTHQLYKRFFLFSLRNKNKKEKLCQNNRLFTKLHMHLYGNGIQTSAIRP
jgi:hypothetical protein